MRVALVVAPFIPVPPPRYGGTELFVAHLAEGLVARGHEPVVYSVGESRLSCEVRWRKPKGRWPLDGETLETSLEDLEHSSWACLDAAGHCDLIHMNNAPGLSFSRASAAPFVYTLHHTHEAAMSDYYAQFPEVQYVAISRSQAAAEPGLRNIKVIHHGLDTSAYRVAEGRRDYLVFLGRIAPIKGVHTAIEVARQAGLPLKIAGEIQPLYRDYWERQIKPSIDGHQIEFVGEVDLEGKNQLFAGARALLFPIEWEEPFGLVMIEAMACGVPVLGFPRGSVPEVVVDGVNGWLCRSSADMARRLRHLPPPLDCRAFVERNFSVDRMVDRYLEVYEAALGAAPPAGAEAGLPHEAALPEVA